MIEIIVAVLLEKKIRKNSSNSGLAPSRNNSSNGNRNKASDKDRENLGNQVENTQNVETSEIVSPSNCTACDFDLSDVKIANKEERKKSEKRSTSSTRLSIIQLLPNPKFIQIAKRSIKASFPKEWMARFNMVLESKRL